MYQITTDYVNWHAADMFVFLMHRRRAKAGALSFGHTTLSLHPELGKVVTRDTRIQSPLSTLLPPLPASLCINNHGLILFLHLGTPPGGVTYMSNMDM